MDKKERDPIFYILCILIFVNVICVAFNIAYMWNHTLTDVDANYMQATQIFLGSTLFAQVVGGFGYTGFKKSQQYKYGIQPNQEKKEEEVPNGSV